MMPARSTDISLMLFHIVDGSLGVKTFVISIGISVLCLFLITDTLHLHGVEWLAVLNHFSSPEELVDVQMA